MYVPFFIVFAADLLSTSADNIQIRFKIVLLPLIMWLDIKVHRVMFRTLPFVMAYADVVHYASYDS